MDLGLMTAGHAFPEWTDLSPGQPIRQGDVLTALDEANEHPWRRKLVIITADCDLAQGKYGGALTCVPFLDAEEYLLNFRFDVLCQPLLNKLVSACLDCKAKDDDTTRAITEERLKEWVLEASNDDLCAALELSGTLAERFGKLADAIRSILGPTPSSVPEAANLIAAAKFAMGHVKDVSKAKKSAATELVSAITKLPGDALFVNQLTDVHTRGYVAYLRRVVELSDAHVATAVSQATGDTSHLRVSRLTSPYIYALSQQFGAVFSAIGLPTAYENARATIIDRLSTEGI